MIDDASVAMSPGDFMGFPTIGKILVLSLSEGIRVLYDVNARQLAFAELLWPK